MGANVVKSAGASRQASPITAKATIKKVEDTKMICEIGKWKPANNEHRVLICRFCGGKKCKREDYKKQKGPAAIVGLHSSWVSDDLCAMQRPSSRLINEHKIIDQFKQNNIFAVINLQANGEHPLCGDGIHKEGFSYKTEEFSDHGVYCYNYGFTDMGVPSIDTMMHIMHSIAFHVNKQKQKLAIHCHAGFGRTGIVCACWLIYNGGMPAEAAMNFVRTSRPGCIETITQKKFVLRFYKDLDHLRRVFIIPPFITDAFTIDDGLARQNNYLHGQERKTLSRVPKIVHELCNALMVKCGDDKSREELADAFLVTNSGCGEAGENQLNACKMQLNVDIWRDVAASNASMANLAQLLLDWLDTLVEPLFPRACTQGILDHPEDESKSAIDGVVSDYTLTTLDRIVKLLHQVQGVDPDKLALVYARFAVALMHPQLAEPGSLPFRTLRATSDWMASFKEKGSVQSPLVAPDQITLLARHLRRFTSEWDAWSAEQEPNKPTLRLVRPRRDPPPGLAGEDLQGTGALFRPSAVSMTGTGTMMLPTSMHSPDAMGLPDAGTTDSGADELENDIAERVSALFGMLSARKQGYVINELLAIYGRTRLLTTPKNAPRAQGFNFNANSGTSSGQDSGVGSPMLSARGSNSKQAGNMRTSARKPKQDKEARETEERERELQKEREMMENMQLRAPKLTIKEPQYL